MKITDILLSLLLATPGLACCGCAVLRVEVDAYQGSLTNNIDVQTGRLAALADLAEQSLTPNIKCKKSDGKDSDTCKPYTSTTGHRDDVNKALMAYSGARLVSDIPKLDLKRKRLLDEVLLLGQTLVSNHASCTIFNTAVLDSAGRAEPRELSGVEVGLQLLNSVDDIRSWVEAHSKHKKQLALALAALESLTSDTSAPGRPRWKKLSTALQDEEAGYSSARDVLDGIILELQLAHIDAMRAQRSPIEIRALGDALRVAEEYRAIMVFVRPAFVYLREDLGGSQSKWHNELDRQLVRSTSFMEPVPGADSVARTLAPPTAGSGVLWKKVNTVRVAGGGNVNYVVAKDGLGNWYVKQYSTDKREVAYAATALALSSTGFAGATPAMLEPILRMGLDKKTIEELDESDWFHRVANREASSQHDLEHARSQLRGRLSDVASRLPQSIQSKTEPAEEWSKQLIAAADSHSATLASSRTWLSSAERASAAEILRRVSADLESYAIKLTAEMNKQHQPKAKNAVYEAIHELWSEAIESSLQDFHAIGNAAPTLRTSHNEAH